MSLQSLNALYASGNVSPIVCLVIQVPVNASYDTLYYYLGNNDTMQLDGKIYSPSSFQVAVPTKSDNGFTDLNFAICNVDNQIYNIYKLFDKYLAKYTSYVILQQFHPETLVKEYELKLTITGIQFTAKQVNFTASFCDMLNTEFPTLRYTQQNCPGLKYVS